MRARVKTQVENPKLQLLLNEADELQSQLKISKK